MKKIKHLSLLLVAALITVSISAQTAKTQPTATKASPLAPKAPLKMQPPTKLPAQPTGKEASKLVVHNSTTKAQPVQPSGGANK